MTNEDKITNSCDGRGFRRALEASTAWLEMHVETINALNVYPVPDGDTGTNMLLTMRAALKELNSSPTQSASVVAHAVSYGALMGARGNSGVILSQLFRGLARSLDKKETFTALDLAQAMTEASVTAYKGVIKPVEGTILTVGREAADAAVAAAKRRLVASMAADVTGLQVLAQERATRIKNYLVQQGNIPDERVVAVWVQLDNVATGNTVRTNLTLAGS